MVVKDKGRKQVEVLASKLETLTVEYVPVNSLTSNEWNPNRQSDHDFDLLRQSMKMDGFTQPILALREGRVIVDGYHRWSMAKELGYTEIPVVFTDMTLQQARLSTLRHNRARGSEDIELVAVMLRDFETMGVLNWAQEELMLDDIEVQRLIEDVAAPDALAAAEFSQAWEPQGTHHAESQDGHDRSIGGAPALEGATASAVERMRTGERMLAEAKNDEERQAAVRDRDIHRVALTFNGEEAAIVRQVLGDQPADKLVDMCRKELEIQRVH